TKVRTKTLEIHEAIMHSQFVNSLYLDADDKIIMPAQNIRKCLIEGARFHKRGKDIERGVVFLSEYVPLEYDGPKNPEKLWEKKQFRDIRSVVIQRRRVMTCRPRFNEWACQINIAFDTTLIDENDLSVAVEQAGALVGIGDYRPLFGRFDGELI
ncbi:unnamed protein product, partial [marine sediment metagenome]